MRRKCKTRANARNERLFGMQNVLEGCLLFMRYQIEKRKKKQLGNGNDNATNKIQYSAQNLHTKIK